MLLMAEVRVIRTKMMKGMKNKTLRIEEYLYANAVGI